jgi:hypothetical protein
MLSLTVIEEHIADLEDRETTYSNCEKLACLYIVRDHLKAETESSRTSTASDDSVYNAVKSLDYEEVRDALASALKIIKTMHPAMYEEMMAKLQE